LNIFAQSDSVPGAPSLFKKPKKQYNTTHLELYYKEHTSSGFDSRGMLRTYTVSVPYVRINDNRSVRLDRKGEVLRKYYVKAPLANEQLDLMNVQRRRGGTQMLVGVIVGGVTAFSGVFAGAKDESKFWPLVGTGGAIFLGGGVARMVHSVKATRHLRKSFELYNEHYYVPLPADTTSAIVKAAGKKDSTSKDVASSYYNIVSNDPDNSGMAGIIIQPLASEVSSTNVNFRAGIGGYYTYKSLFGITALYQLAYFDNMGGNYVNGSQMEYTDLPGVPTKYRRTSQFEIQTKTSLLSWHKTKRYNIASGLDMDGNKAGKVKGPVTKALTGRLGYQLDNRLIEKNTGGIPFTTTTAPYEYTAENGAVSLLTPHSLEWSAAMMKSNIVGIGVGLSTFRDIEISVNEETYRGHTKERSQTDLYVDLLYAHSLQLQDIIYNHGRMDDAGDEIMQQLDISSTPVRKMGFRIGYQYTGSYRAVLGKRYGAELGFNPGPKLESGKNTPYFRIFYGLVFGGKIR
jgi:hypothetical protein